MKQNYYNSEHLHKITCCIPLPPVPNPPGPIKILSKTTSSIETQWTEAPLMTGAKFYYLLTYTSSQQSKNITTTNTRWNFSPLSSGTSYNISVTTVGELGFQSETVYIYMVTTSKAFISVKKYCGSLGSLLFHLYCMNNLLYLSNM